VLVEDWFPKPTDGPNLIGNPLFDEWPSGDSSAPAYWSLAGSGAAVSRAGTGLSDTTRKIGDFCAKVVAGAGATAQLSQAIFASSESTYDDGFDATNFAGGMWVWASAASTARVGTFDGSRTRWSKYHTGNSTWQWLKVPHPVHTSADRFVFRGQVAASGTGYFSGAVCQVGSRAPDFWVPAPMVRGFVGLSAPGTQATATTLNAWRFDADRPMMVVNTVLKLGTVNTGAAFIVDVNKDGSSMYTGTLPQIADGAATARGNLAPNGTYANRCLTQGSVLTVDIDQVGSTIPGTDLTVEIYMIAYQRPMEPFLLPGSLGQL
jgi:hypothetical protein